MSDSAAQVVIRKAIPADKDFIMDAWIKGQYYGSPHWVQVPKQVFHSKFAAQIIKILEKPETNVEVAVLGDDTNMILAFVVHSDQTLHWAHTKADYRGKGIINMLLKGKNITVVTSTTLPGAAITKKKKLIFNPFIGN